MGAGFSIASSDHAGKEEDEAEHLSLHYFPWKYVVDNAVGASPDPPGKKERQGRHCLFHETLCCQGRRLFYS